ncbi:MAG: T9SS type A sorting domain-containing protein, partial [Saprospiraceae bacterium]|nr:T9SS type A sorting domain-containing protein [Saprospiraceae bacterium]
RTISARNLNMDANQSGELTVHFYPEDENYCEGIVHLKIKNLDNLNDTLVAVYTLNLATKVTDLPQANVQIFPNPTADYFSLKNAGEVGSLELFSLEGRLVATMNVDDANQYSLAQQPAGNYILALRDKKGRLFQALEINKK